MNENLIKYSKILGFEILGLLLIFILIINTTSFQIEQYINFSGLSFLSAILISYSLYYSYLNSKENDKQKTKKIIFYLFIISLIGIIIGNLAIIFDNIYVFNILNILTKYNTIFYPILISQIILSLLLINQNNIGLKKKSQKNPRLTKNKKIVLISIFLIIITLISFYLRLYNVENISPGRDSLHHYIAAKSINDNGSTVYETLPYVNHMLAFIFKNIGETLILAKLPFIIAGTLSVLLIFFIGRKISNTVGIISAILFAICPWAIGLSSYVRDYSLNIFYELLLINILLYFPKNINEKRGLIKYIILNLIIYASLIIFAKTQGGMTISIIIALIITTSIRAFAELDFYNKIKSLSINSKEVNLFLSAAIFMLTVGIFVIYVFGFDKRLILTYQPRWLFFFLSESRLPTLWYSFMQVPWYFIVSLTLIPFIVKFKDKIVWISFLIFYSYIAFFVFFAKPISPLLYARYVYAGLPFFIILISVTIYYLFEIGLKISRNVYVQKISFIIVLIFVLTIFNFNNTLYAISGKDSTERSARQVISDPYFDYTEVINFLRDNGFSKDDIVIASELRMKDTLAWYFDFDFYKGRNSTSFNTYTYDIADNIYIIEQGPNNAEIVKQYNQGWIVRRDGDIFPQSISLRSKENVDPVPELKQLNITIEYLGIYSEKYEVYVWKRE